MMGEDNSTSLPYLDVLALWQEEDETLFYIYLIATLTSLVLLLVSTVIDLLLLCSVSLKRPTKGHFGLLNLFVLLHWLYFLILGASWSALSLFGDEVELKWTILLAECPVIVLGVSMLVLGVITVDCLVKDGSKEGKSNQGCWGCCRLLICLMSLLIGVLVLAAVVIIRHPQVMAHFLGRNMWAKPSDTGKLLVHSLQLLLFAFVPSFVIVIVGTVNWVSDANSTRAVSTQHRLSRQLDHCMLLVAVPVLLLLTIKIISELSLDLDVFHDISHLELVNMSNLIVGLGLSFAYFAFDLVLLCVLAEDVFCTRSENI